MKKKQQYDQPIEMTPEEAEKMGEAKAFFRVVIFETGVCSDGNFNIQKMISALCMLMIERPEVRKILKQAVKLNKKIGKDLLAVDALKQVISEDDNADCQCPTCQMMREIQRQQKDN